MSDVRLFFAQPLIRLIASAGLLGLLSSFILLDVIAALVSFACGAAVYAVAEYAVHRYLLHEFPKLLPVLFKGHLDHHRHPQDLKHLFSPVSYDAMTYVGYLLALRLLTGSMAIAIAVATGSLLFQLYYQWMHYVAHRPRVPSSAWGKWMKKKHLLHHYKDEHSWYGVSHPVLDYALGTNKDDHRQVPMKRSEGNEGNDRKGDLVGIGIGGSGQGAGREGDR